MMSKSSYPGLFTILNLVHSRIATVTLARTVKMVVIARTLIFREDDLQWYHRVHRMMCQIFQLKCLITGESEKIRVGGVKK
jgi:hypothetical protein